MKKLDFYKEGTTLFYVNRDKGESFFYNMLIVILGSIILGVYSISLDDDWIGNIIETMIDIVFIIIFLLVAYTFFTEGDRPHNSKYFNTVINSNLYYEKITPEKEGFNPNNQLTNFDIIKFINEKGDVLKIISNTTLPWGFRKVHISKEYLPFKKEIVDFLNENYTV
jgi:hypothetical protein